MSTSCNSCNQGTPKCPTTKVCCCKKCPEPPTPSNPCENRCIFAPLPSVGPALYTGEGLPLSNIGKNNDYYLDRDTCILYQKQNGLWVELGPLCAQDTVCAAFVQETAPTEGMVNGSLWVNTTTNVLYYYNNGVWTPIEDLAAFARTNTDTAIAPNQITTTLVNPVVPQNGTQIVNDLADVIMDYQYALNVTPTSPDPIVIPLEDNFVSSIFAGVTDVVIPGGNLAVASIKTRIEFEHLPRILITFDERRDGSVVLTRQIAQDVPMPLLYEGLINLSAPASVEAGSSVIDIELSDPNVSVTSQGPFTVAIQDGTLVVTLDVENLSFVGNVAVQKIIEKSLNSEVQIENVQIEWGFPNATLHLERANYTLGIQYGDPLADTFISGPVFVPDAPNLITPFTVEWVIEAPVEDSSVIDNSNLVSGGGVLPDITLTPTNEGYGVYFDLLLLNVDTSELLRSGSKNLKHNLLTRGGNKLKLPSPYTEKNRSSYRTIKKKSKMKLKKK